MSFQQSSTHSAALPAVSYSPKPLGRNEPVATICLLVGLPQVSHCARPEPTSLPHQNGVLVPARAAYSHSASVGRRYFCPDFCDNQPTKSLLASQLTLITGLSPRPQP